ncbi:MAG: hypothetical protein EHM72_19545, partial [Calditrichaeota bacterium]
MKKRKLSEYKSFMGGNLFVLILISFLSPLCGQENLIINGGFENGLSGWSSFWSRTPNAGSVEIVSDLYHSGGHAAFIEHHDPQDWSFAVNKRYA